MVNFKRLGRIAVCLLFCCAACLVFMEPAAAASPSRSPLSAETSVAATASTDTGYAGHETSIVYRYATRNSFKIGCLENGTRITVLDTNGEFYKINCYDMVGYIAKSQVVETEAGEYYVNCVEDSAETRILNSYGVQEALDLKSEVKNWGVKYIGVPYVWGGTSPYGFDCSGLVQYVFDKAGVSLGRSTVHQLEYGVVIPKQDLQCGDLVFFSNTGDNGGFCSHVGIYLGNGQLLHSGSNGVTIVDLESEYFVRHYMCSRRMILSDLAPTAFMPSTGVLLGSHASFWRNEEQDPTLGMG